MDFFMDNEYDFGHYDHEKTFMTGIQGAPVASSEFIEPTSQILHDATEIRDTTMPDDMVISAVKKSCDWFNLPEMPVINADQTCVWNGDPGTAFDDVFGFNRQELMDMGIKGEDSLTLVYTHECAHRAMQGHINDSWEEELACDFFAGIHAREAGIDTTNFEQSLCSTCGGPTHPSGALRSEFISLGKNVQYDMKLEGEPLTFENCIKRFNQCLKEKSEMITEYRAQDDPTYGQKVTELRGFAIVENFDDRHGFVNDKDWHLDEARKATERGDHAAAKDHIKSAGMCSK